MTETSPYIGYVPTQSDLDEMIDEVFDAAKAGDGPLVMVDDLGKALFITLPEHSFTIEMPWESVAGIYVLGAYEGRIEWVHPALRERLGRIGVADFERVAEGTEATLDDQDLKPDVVYDQFCRDLAKLDARLEHSMPIFNGVRSMVRYASAADAVSALNRLIQQTGASIAVGWGVAQIALGANPPKYFDEKVTPLTRAATIGHMLDPELVPCPDQAEVRQALAYLHAVQIHPGQSGSVLRNHVATVAAGIAHGLIPNDLARLARAAPFDMDILRVRLEEGYLDPGIDNETYDCELILGAVASLINGRESVSNHEIIPIIECVNERLKAVGHPRTITPKECRSVAEATALKAPF